MTKHVLSATQFQRAELDALFSRADEFKTMPRSDRRTILRGRTVGVIF